MLPARELLTDPSFYHAALVIPRLVTGVISKPGSTTGDAYEEAIITIASYVPLARGGCKDVVSAVDPESIW